MQLLGADTPIKPARAEVFNKTFTVLQQLLALWNSQGLNFGLVYPETLGDELNEPEQTQLAIDHMLAIKASSYIQKSPTEGVRTEAKILMQQLRTQFSPKPGTIFPETLPIGTGNKTYPIGPTFYPTSEDNLTTENGDPITT